MFYVRAYLGNSRNVYNERCIERCLQSADSAILARLYVGWPGCVADRYMKSRVCYAENGNHTSQVVSPCLHC